MSNKINLDELDLDAVLDSDAEFKLGSSDALLSDTPKCEEVIQAIDDIAGRDICRFNLRTVYYALIGGNTENIRKDGFMTFLTKNVIIGFKEFHGKIVFVVKNIHLGVLGECKYIYLNKEDMDTLSSMIFDKTIPDSGDKDTDDIHKEYCTVYIQEGIVYSLLSEQQQYKFGPLLRAQLSLFNRELETALFNSKIVGICEPIESDNIVPGDMKAFIRDLRSEDKKVYSQAMYCAMGITIDAWVDDDESTDLLVITVSTHKGKKCYTFSNSEKRGIVADKIENVLALLINK